MKNKSSKRFSDFNYSIESMDGEVWCNCVFVDNGILYDYGGLYMVSNLGRVKGFRRKSWKDQSLSEIILSVHMDYGGYLNVKLCKNNKSRQIGLHRLVGLLFCPNPKNKLEINHKKGIKTDCRATELEWNTPSENVKHAFITGLRKSWAKGQFGSKHNRSKAVNQYTLDGVLLSSFGSCKEAERETGISNSGINATANGKASMAGGFFWKFKDNVA